MGHAWKLTFYTGFCYSKVSNVLIKNLKSSNFLLNVYVIT